jgi:hypothetical protein
MKPKGWKRVRIVHDLLGHSCAYERDQYTAQHAANGIDWVLFHDFDFFGIYPRLKDAVAAAEHQIKFTKTFRP